jgi:tetratricopeptide (TPR) repeat protein
MSSLGYDAICPHEGKYATPPATLKRDRIAVQQNPETRRLRLERALELERAGRTRESLALLEALALEADASPDLLVLLGRALGFANRAMEAEELIAGALARWPVDARLHSLLVELRWQRGVGGEAAASLEQAIRDFPAELQLRLVAADLLRNMGFPDRALRLLEEGLGHAPDSAAFLTSTGVMLDELGRSKDALAPLRAAIPRARNPALAQRNLVPALLRTGAVQEALSICDALLAATPDDQMVLAYRTTALRLAGDAEHARLCDYGRLARTYVLDPPPSYGGIEKFNEAMARALTPLHHAMRRPIAQSLRGGTQTGRNDLPADDPVIADFMRILDAPIRDYISRLDATSHHPVDRRKREGYRVTGSWSVLLSPGGFHVDHVHPQGWLSSAYYVELPQVGRDETRAAWLKFGEPGVKVGLPPEHFVEPRAGMLVLFPSYFWHGTVPFHEGGGRLTAAFDVVPAS